MIRKLSLTEISRRDPPILFWGALFWPRKELFQPDCGTRLDDQLSSSCSGPWWMILVLMGVNGVSGHFKMVTGLLELPA
jgi:hypothetical protein